MRPVALQGLPAALCKPMSGRQGSASPAQLATRSKASGEALPRRGDSRPGAETAQRPLQVQATAGSGALLEQEVRLEEPVVAGPAAGDLRTWQWRGHKVIYQARTSWLRALPGWTTACKRCRLLRADQCSLIHSSCTGGRPCVRLCVHSPSGLCARLWGEWRALAQDDARTGPGSAGVCH